MSLARRFPLVLLGFLAFISTAMAAPAVVNVIVYLANANAVDHSYSAHGLLPTARLPGGALGVKPSLTSLKPDLSLKPNHN